MDKANVVFCTTAACRDRALHWQDKSGEKFEVKTWPATLNLVDEAACANPLELLLPLATFNTLRRVICGGDHQQLPSYLSTLWQPLDSLFI